MAVATLLAGLWWHQFTLQSSGTDMVVVGFVQHGQSSLYGSGGVGRATAVPQACP